MVCILKWDEPDAYFESEAVGAKYAGASEIIVVGIDAAAIDVKLFFHGLERYLVSAESGSDTGAQGQFEAIHQDKVVTILEFSTEKTAFVLDDFFVRILRGVDKQNAFSVHFVMVEITVKDELDIVSQRCKTIADILLVVNIEAVSDNVAVKFRFNPVVVTVVLVKLSESDVTAFERRIVVVVAYAHGALFPDHQFNVRRKEIIETEVALCRLANVPVRTHGIRIDPRGREIALHVEDHVVTQKVVHLSVGRCQTYGDNDERYSFFHNSYLFLFETPTLHSYVACMGLFMNS